MIPFERRSSGGRGDDGKAECAGEVVLSVSAGGHSAKAEFGDALDFVSPCPARADGATLWIKMSARSSTTFLPITLCASLIGYLTLTRRERFWPSITAL